MWVILKCSHVQACTDDRDVPNNYPQGCCLSWGPLGDLQNTVAKKNITNENNSKIKGNIQS